MLLSHATVAVRNLLNQKLYSCINVLGLAAGICCFLLIMLFLRQELAYDRHYANAERIYRISLDIRPPDGAAPVAMAANAPQVGPLLLEEQAEVESIARLVDWQGWLKLEGEEALYRRMAFVDPAFVDIFDFEWLAGAPTSSALADPASIVLTASSARQLFGTRPALGNTVQLVDGGRSARVTGVIADPGPETHLAFDALLPIDGVAALYGPNIFRNWSMQVFHTYVLLRDGASPLQLAQAFPSFVERHLGAQMKGIFLYEATPLTSLHLNSSRRGELKTPGTMATVRAFIAVALVVLLVASINFMNLATVRATRRAREVGVRKAIGASRYHVMVQFLGEALLLTTLAVLLGVMGAELLLPPFNALIGRELDLDLSATVWLLPVLIIGLTLVAGAYPAFYLASFNAAKVLRGSDTGAATGQWFRKALVVFQFSAAVALLIAAWVIEAQLRHVRNVDLGYERENVVVLDNIGAEGVGRDWDLLKQQLLMHPDIVAVTALNSLPSSAVGAGYYFEYDGGADSRTMPVALVDFDYFETFGIPFVAGRAFSHDFASDVPAAGRGGAFVLSESAVRQLGWTPEQALGQRVGLTCCGMENGIVVGVARDVQHGSVHAPRGPIVYVIPPEPVDRIHSETRLGLQRIALKLSGNNLEDTLAYIDATWKARRPEQAMSLAFLDEKLAGLYLNEERQGRVLAAFALLAIVITCMGLYGLSSYNALLRTKEIGVRKVMGGSVWSIVLLLTNDFSRLVLLSNLIAWPLAYVAMERWLQTFAYRIDLAPFIFIGSGLIALCIAWATVGGTAAKAANAKPVLALRYE